MSNNDISYHKLLKTSFFSTKRWYNTTFSALLFRNSVKKVSFQLPLLKHFENIHKKYSPKNREYLKQYLTGSFRLRRQDDVYSTFNFVMLFAQMPIVDTLCKNADVVGESRPKNPPTSKLVLNVMIKR